MNPLRSTLITTLLIGLLLLGSCSRGEIKGEIKVPRSVAYHPVIDPLQFTTQITNPYYVLIPGTIFTYEGKTSEGTERNIVVVTDRTKTIMGVTTVEVWDRVWLNDDLIEETYDWYAQDLAGNVWYLGEDSSEYENGKVVSTEGSWEGGVGGALPGIIMEADPKAGDSYRQEYLKGEAEDMADVVSLGESVTVAYGSFSGCLKTRDWSLMDAKLNEYKFYCPGARGLALEIVADSGERTELVSVNH